MRCGGKSCTFDKVQNTAQMSLRILKGQALKVYKTEMANHFLSDWDSPFQFEIDMGID